MEQADKARLVLNSPELANRWVEFAGVRYPVLHLSLGALEQFRAFCAPIEALYLKFSESERSLVEFLSLYPIDVFTVFRNSVPQAASIVLGIQTAKIVAVARPLEAFQAVLAQWVHNLEIGALQTAFPAPENDPDEQTTPDYGNPLSTVQKLMSAYHCSFEDALSRTTPQVYLLGVDAAWSYESMKPEGKTRSRRTPTPPTKGGKRWKSADEYRQYLETLPSNLMGVL